MRPADAYRLRATMTTTTATATAAAAAAAAATAAPSVLGAFHGGEWGMPRPLSCRMPFSTATATATAAATVAVTAAAGACAGACSVRLVAGDAAALPRRR